MSQKNETAILAVTLLITAALVGGGIWWFTKQPGISNSNSPQSSPNTSANNSPATANSIGSFAQVQNVPSGLFNYGGSTSWAPIRLAVDSAIQVARPEFRLRYVDPATGAASSTSGIKMLLDGRLAFTQSSRPLRDQEYQQAQQRGFTLQTIPVAIDGLAVAVNPNLNISGLTIQQLRDIYTGKITNWQQLGGANVPIKAYSRPLNSGGTVELFVEEILSNQPFGKNVEFVSTTTDALRRIANSPGGIYYASAPEVVPQCTIKPVPVGRNSNQLVAPYKEPFVPLQDCPGKRNQLNIEAFQKGDYPITRNLFVVIKNTQIDQQAGNAYANLLLSNEGQELISKAGFVRVR